MKLGKIKDNEQAAQVVSWRCTMHKDGLIQWSILFFNAFKGIFKSDHNSHQTTACAVILVYLLNITAAGVQPNYCVVWRLWKTISDHFHMCSGSLARMTEDSPTLPVKSSWLKPQIKVEATSVTITQISKSPGDAWSAHQYTPPPSWQFWIDWTWSQGLIVCIYTS